MKININNKRLEDMTQKEFMCLFAYKTGLVNKGKVSKNEVNNMVKYALFLKPELMKSVLSEEMIHLPSLRDYVVDKFSKGYTPVGLCMGSQTRDEHCYNDGLWHYERSHGMCKDCLDEQLEIINKRKR